MKGILFKPDNIKAIVEGRKTQTRRRVNIDSLGWIYKGIFYGMAEFDHKDSNERISIRPRYQVGETVYIKEAWSSYGVPPNEKAFYKDEKGLDIKAVGWHTPLFMPEWAARYFITITDIRAEKLQSITEEDAKAEGAPEIFTIDNDQLLYPDVRGYRRGFLFLWNCINKDYQWESNLWVWVYGFKLNENNRL